MEDFTSRTRDAVSGHARLAIVYRPIKMLKANSHNPRLHSQKQLRQLAKSIEKFGFNVPVLIDSDLRILAGHGRVQACQLLNLNEVPTISIDHLSEEQARAFLIADNKLTLNAEWDEQLLAV